MSCTTPDDATWSCTGDAEYGGLGSGLVDARTAMGTVVGGFRVVRPSPDALHGPHCGVTSDGRARCWGWTANGLLEAAGIFGQTLTPSIVPLP
jgi:hypothetical protein